MSLERKYTYAIPLYNIFDILYYFLLLSDTVEHLANSFTIGLHVGFEIFVIQRVDLRHNLESRLKTTATQRRHSNQSVRRHAKWRRLSLH